MTTSIRHLARAARHRRLPLLLVGLRRQEPAPSRSPRRSTTRPMAQAHGAVAGAGRRRRSARCSAGAADRGGEGAHLQGHRRAREGPAAGRRRCRRARAAQPAGGGVVLNFEGADLREVVRNILGDILNESYTIDPAGRRHGDDPHVVGHSARGAAGDARNAAADERRDDDQGRRHLQDRAAGRRRCAATSRRSSAIRSARCRPASRCRSCRCATSACGRCCGILEPFAKDAHGRAPRRAAQHADPRRAPSASCGTCWTRSTCSTSTGWRACRSGVFTLQNADVKTVMAGARQGRSATRRHEPARGHPAHHPDRAHERAARDHAAARVPRRGEEVDRAPRPGRRRRRRRASTSTTCRTSAPRSWRRCCSRRSPGARAAAGAASAPTLAPGTPAGTIVSRRRRSRRSPVGQPTVATNPTAAPRDRTARPTAARRARAARGHRHRAQHPGGRRQGQQHAAASSPPPPSTR